MQFVPAPPGSLADGMVVWQPMPRLRWDPDVPGIPAESHPYTWRDDGMNPTEQPFSPFGRVEFVSIKAEDPIIDDGDYALFICHVVCHGGNKAFMAAIRYYGCDKQLHPGETGNAHRGENYAAYSKSKEEGAARFLMLQVNQDEARARLLTVKPD